MRDMGLEFGGKIRQASEGFNDGVNVNSFGEEDL